MRVLWGLGAAVLLAACSPTPFGNAEAGTDASAPSSGGSGSAATGSTSGASTGGTGSAATGTASAGASGAASGNATGASASGVSGSGTVVGDASAGPCPGGCPAGSICHVDPSGTAARCAQECTDSAQCMSIDAPCCGPDVAGKIRPSDTWVCVAGALNCRCASVASCPNNGCGPATDAVGNPIGPHVCKLNDGRAYDGCGVCCSNSPAGYQCHISGGNSFCALGCTADKDCGDPGVVCCNKATCDNCLLGCTDVGVCGPC
jgi:hypothetical protein